MSPAVPRLKWGATFTPTPPPYTHAQTCMHEALQVVWTSHWTCTKHIQICHSLYLTLRPNLHWSPLSPLCTEFSPLMWLKFAICSNMGLHFSTEHHNASPDPLLLRKSRWHNSLQPETVRAHRERREGRWKRRGGEGWRGRGARLVDGRPIQLHSLLSAAASGGGIQLFQNSPARGGAPLNEGVGRCWPSCRTRFKGRKEARWQCVFPNA